MDREAKGLIYKELPVEDGYNEVEPRVKASENAGRGG